MKPAKFDHGNYGMHGGKHDLERWGVFAEMLYLHGQGMTAVPLYSKRAQGKQLYPGFPKWKVGLQDCYFDKEFKRIFQGEALNSLYKREIKDRLESKQKFLTPGGIRPPPGAKLHSTPGDFYGTFGGIVQALDPRRRPRTNKKPELKTNAAQRPDNKYSKFPEWMPEKYDPKAVQKAKKDAPPFRSGGPGRLFDANPYATSNWRSPTFRKLREIPWNLHGPFIPSKTPTRLDGMKGGCFSKYPGHSADRYLTPLQVERLRNKMDKHKGPGEAKKFVMCGAGKTWPLFSVLDLNVNFRTNVKNYGSMRPYTYTREFLHEISTFDTYYFSDGINL